MTYLVIPRSTPVEDDGRAEAPRRVNPRAGDGNGGQMNEEDGEPDGERSQNLLQPVNDRKGRKQAMKAVVGALTGTCESRALRLASVAEKTV